jgi:hypothetical protein
MGTLFRSRLVVLMIALLVLVLSCTVQVQEIKVEGAGLESQLLVGVIRTSSFKNTIVDGIVDEYRAICSIEVVRAANMPDIAADTYDAVVLVDEIRGGMRLNGKLKSIIDESATQKIVVFLTAGDAENEYSYGGFDAITSASQNDAAQEAIQRIAVKIDGMLE